MAASLGRHAGPAAWLTRWAPALAITAALAIIAADHYLGLTGGLTARALKRIGKGLGELTAGLALLSLAYYLVREFYVRLVLRAFVHPAVAAPVKALLDILRLTHPAVGALTAATAAVHGYLLWSGRLPVDEATGLAAMVIMVFLYGTGLLLAVGNRGAALRPGHRFAALAFLLLFAVHKLVAD